MDGWMGKILLLLLLLVLVFLLVWLNEKEQIQGIHRKIDWFRTEA
jgi:hypothetical protein